MDNKSGERPLYLRLVCGLMLLYMILCGLIWPYAMILSGLIQPYATVLEVTIYLFYFMKKLLIARVWQLEKRKWEPLFQSQPIFHNFLF